MMMVVKEVTHNNDRQFFFNVKQTRIFKHINLLEFDLQLCCILFGRKVNYGKTVQIQHAWWVHFFGGI